jgi:hypothetical protein
VRIKVSFHLTSRNSNTCYYRKTSSEASAEFSWRLVWALTRKSLTMELLLPTGS